MINIYVFSEPNIFKNILNLTKARKNLLTFFFLIDRKYKYLFNYLKGIYKNCITSTFSYVKSNFAC